MSQRENICIAIADLQGFIIDGKDFVLKELCFSILNKNHINEKAEYHHYIFAPPFEWQQLTKQCHKNAIWLRTFHHGFFWKQGQISYNDRTDYIKPLLRDNLIIVVKGCQKIKWLKEFCSNFKIDVRDFDDVFTDAKFALSVEAFKLSNVHHCRMHHIVKHCAKQNVKIIENWIKELIPKCTTSSSLLFDHAC